MKEQLDRLESKMDKLSETVGNHLISAEKRMCRVETVQKGFLWIAGTLGLGVVGYLVNLGLRHTL